jgi:hypothetical protein
MVAVALPLLYCIGVMSFLFPNEKDCSFSDVLMPGLVPISLLFKLLVRD